MNHSGIKCITNKIICMKCKKSLICPKINFKILLTGLLLLISGYIIMKILYNNHAISFITHYLSPILILSGYVILGISILYDKSNVWNKKEL